MNLYAPGFMRMKLKRLRLGCVLLLIAVMVTGAGCGAFVARRIAQAPNTYPDWIAPTARVTLDFSAGFLTNFPSHYLDIGPPPARLRYRVIEPADYHMETTSSNWIEHGEQQFTFTFKANLPADTNRWTGNPRGTVILLHGWGVAQFAMAPWALRLAEEGWRCVLVDLRGHGKSTGKRIYFGLRETNDLTELLNQLDHDGKLTGPVMAVGESYGAVIALRWAGAEPRLRAVVAINPYASLSNAVMNIGRDYAGWVPGALLRAGMKKLPVLLDVEPAELDTTTVLARHPVQALFFAAPGDKVSPVEEVQKDYALASPGSLLIVVPGATHESLTYFFGDLAPPIVAWLAKQK
jgi:pimeloyl-ACP methyl ester carboxylesterase